MANYFDDPEKQLELKRILDEWMGTPFRHHCGVKKLGCDCIHFVARVFEEMGVLRWRKNLVPDYPRDWHLHNTRELLLERLVKELNVIPADLNHPMNGDILLSHYGKASSHAAIYCDGYIYQSVDGIGVCKINFSDATFRRQMKYAFRVIT
jgi:cell wall-associated NlpC family hydrolase